MQIPRPAPAANGWQLARMVAYWTAQAGDRAAVPLPPPDLQGREAPAKKPTALPSFCSSKPVHTLQRSLATKLAPVSVTLDCQEAGTLAPQHSVADRHHEERPAWDLPSWGPGSHSSRTALSSDAGSTSNHLVTCGRWRVRELRGPRSDSQSPLVPGAGDGRKMALELSRTPCSLLAEHLTVISHHILYGDSTISNSGWVERPTLISQARKSMP